MNPYTDKTSALIHDSRYPAAEGVALHRGQVVILAENTVKPATAQQTGAILGICLDNLDAGHAADAMVCVADSPSTIFTCDAPEITVTSGTTSTVSDTTLATFTDDAFTGGALKFIRAAASGTNTTAPGTVYSVSDYTASNKTFTLGSTLSVAAASGDVYQVFPPIGASLGALNSTLDALILTTATSNFALRVVGWDTQAGKLLLMANVHLYGSKNA